MKQQRGSIHLEKKFKRSKAVWFGRWWETMHLPDGTTKRVQRSRQLAAYSDRYRTKSDVQPLLDEILRPLNQGGRSKFNQQLDDFVENVYLPHVAEQQHRSTEVGYREKWRNYLKPLAADVWLRDVRTADVQNMLNTIAKRHPHLRSTTLQRCKSLLSGVFAYAKRMGDFDGVNPVFETEIPSSAKASSKDTHAYSITDINSMLLALPSPAHEIIAVASYAGLSRSEIQGMCWENYTGQELSVERGQVHGVFDEPKTKERKALIPAIPRLRKILDKYRLTLGNPSSGVMFANENKNPVSLNNLSNRVIIPALNRCIVCGKPNDDKHRADHKFERDSSLPEWCGYHACRRGLATNLHSIGIDDITIMRILRHSSVEVTRRCYIKTLPQQVTDAMTKLDAKLGTIQ